MLARNPPHGQRAERMILTILGKEADTMLKNDPPGECPAAVRAGGGGSGTQGAQANHWKQWDAKPEAAARLSRAMLVRLHGIMANHRKRWDAKPEAAVRRSRAMPVRLHARQTAGNGGTQSQRLRGPTPVRPYARSVTGFFFASEHILQRKDEFL